MQLSHNYLFYMQISGTIFACIPAHKPLSSAWPV